MFSLNTVFDDMAPVMSEFTKNAHEIGLSQKDAAKAATFLGSVLKQSGFSMAETSEQTQKLVGLGVDLAATYGYDVQEALLGMTALFRGEYDPIEKFGVAMKQSEINAELAARGQNNLSPALRRNAEQIVRMELLYERAADATGAFTGQSGNLFVEQKKLQAQFENMQASIGTQLLPVMGALVEALVPLVDYLGPKISQAVTDSLPALQGFTDLIKDMSDSTTTTGQTMEFLTTTLGSFFGFIAGNFGVLVQLSLLIGGVTLSLQLFTAALTFITAHPIIATLTALAALFLLVANANKNLTYATDETAASVTSFNTSLAQSASASEYVGGKYGIVATELGNVRRQAEAATESLDDVLRAMDVLSPNQASNRARRNQMRSDNRARAALASIAAPTAGGTGGGTGGGKDLAAEAAKAAEKAAKELADAMEKAAKEAAKEQERIADELQDALNQAAKVEADRLQRREDAYKSFADSVKSIFGGIKDSIMSAFSLPDLGNSVNSLSRNIQKLMSRTKDFARNITSLSQQGLTNDLLQQVIAAGPIQGGRLAQSLAGAGGGFISQLNQAYGEFGGIASDIAGVGTRSAFANQQVVNNYYEIEVSGGVGSGPTIGRAIVDAIKSYERTSGAVWQGA
jgi:signal transduction histidine kinase